MIADDRREDSITVAVQLGRGELFPADILTLLDSKHTRRIGKTLHDVCIKWLFMEEKAIILRTIAKGFGTQPASIFQTEANHFSSNRQRLMNRELTSLTMDTLIR